MLINARFYPLMLCEYNMLFYMQETKHINRWMLWKLSGKQRITHYHNFPSIFLHVIPLSLHHFHSVSNPSNKRQKCQINNLLKKQHKTKKQVDGNTFNSRAHWSPSCLIAYVCCCWNGDFITNDFTNQFLCANIASRNQTIHASTVNTNVLNVFNFE